MIIRDKQDLRRCVKQAVRRAEVVETRLDFDILHGEIWLRRVPLGRARRCSAELSKRLPR